MPNVTTIGQICEKCCKNQYMCQEPLHLTFDTTIKLVTSGQNGLYIKSNKKVNLEIKVKWCNSKIIQVYDFISFQPEWHCCITFLICDPFVICANSPLHGAVGFLLLTLKSICSQSVVKSNWGDLVLYLSTILRYST